MTTFGLNAKPNSTNPIGYFGTGLKYAVAIILRMGGKMRLFIDGVEYEFYVSAEDFRGKQVSKIRMKKRKGLLSRWQYDALPFTTELGKNWGLWQAHRELESNTRDEGGHSYLGVAGESTDYWLWASVGKTVILVEQPQWAETTQIENEVFLDNPGEMVLENERFRMYDAPSKYLYYRGVRVHDMRYPARFTYDFKQGYVELSEDRSAKNAYTMFWYLERAFRMEIHEEGLLYKALNRHKEDAPMFFEGHDLSFSSTECGVSNAFCSVAQLLSIRGFATTSVSGAWLSMRPMVVNLTPSTRIELFNREWETIIEMLDYAGQDDLREKIKGNF